MPTKAMTKQALSLHAVTNMRGKVTKTTAVPTKSKMMLVSGQDAPPSVKAETKKAAVLTKMAEARRREASGQDATPAVRSRVTKPAAVPTEAKMKQASVRDEKSGLKSQDAKSAAVPAKASTKRASGLHSAISIKSKVAKDAALPKEARTKQASGQDVETSHKRKATKNAWIMQARAALTAEKQAPMGWVMQARAALMAKKQAPGQGASKAKKQAPGGDASTGVKSAASNKTALPSAKTKRVPGQGAVAGAKSEASKDASWAPDLKAPDAALLAAYASAPGPTCGDDVFAHPHVKELLANAQKQVLEALKGQKCSAHEKWLICIRTYGRAKPQDDSDLDSFMQRLGKWMEKKPSSDERQRWSKKFKNAGVTTYTEFAAALEEPAEFVKRLTGIPGEFKIRLQVIERLAKAVKEHGSKCLRAKGMHRGMLDLTLKALEMALGHDAHKHCLIFVSHEDPDFVSGRYHEALVGTPWQKRIVIGVKGAHHQVRFIEEAAPKGTHLVVADDNIDSIIAEIANEKSIPKFDAPPTEGKDCKTRCLRYDEFEDLLDGTGLQAVPEDPLQRFLRAADPKFNSRAKKKELQEYSQELSSLSITTPEGLVEALSQPKKVLDQRLRKWAKRSMLGKLQAQLKHGRLPVRRWLVKAKTKAASKAAAAVPRESTSELASLIRRAGQEMNDTGSNLWSICPSKNGYFLHSRGDDIRKNAKTHGYCVDTGTKLGLMYGALFGFRALHDPERYTRFGQIKDDVERSLRYWHKDGIILRFTRYAVVKAQPPGKFHARKGGISAGSSEEAHKERGHQSLQAILDEFASPYARFPKAGEKCGDCGVIWEASSMHQPGMKDSLRKRKQPDETKSVEANAQAIPKAQVTQSKRPGAQKAKHQNLRSACNKGEASRPGAQEGKRQKMRAASDEHET